MILSCVPWTGCVSSAEMVALQPPDLSCQPDPPPPKGDDPVDVGIYILRLWRAGESCRSSVADYREWTKSLPGAEQWK